MTYQVILRVNGGEKVRTAVFKDVKAVRTAAQIVTFYYENDDIIGHVNLSSGDYIRRIYET